MTTHCELGPFNLVDMPASILLHIVRPSTTAQPIVITIDERGCINKLDINAAAHSRAHSRPDSKGDIFICVRTIHGGERQCGEQAVCTSGLSHLHRCHVAFSFNGCCAIETGERAMTDEGDIAVALVLYIDPHSVGCHREAGKIDDKNGSGFRMM